MHVRRGPVWIISCLAAIIGIGLGLIQATGGPAHAQVACDLIVNGGFETNAGWVALPGPIPPRYVNSPVHSGARSLLLGIPPGSSNQQSTSAARQSVSIPADATSATLTFWYLASIPGSPSAGYAQFALLASDGQTPLTQPWRSFNSNVAWNQINFDLMPWRGQTVQVQFSVYNDGTGPAAYMYLDDVTLPACPGGGTAQPTSTSTYTPQPVSPTPSATQEGIPTSPGPSETPIPAGTPVGPATPPGPPYADCVDLARNGGFEEGLAGWQTAPDRIPVQLVSNPVSWGDQALRLGTMDQNINSYSSIRQPVYIPRGYGDVVLDFWTWTWAEAPGGADRQEADFLAPDLAVLQKFWRVLTNDQAWVRHTFSVTPYAGEDVVLYFNVYNDGTSGRAAMYLDEVHLWACNRYGSAKPEPYGPYTQPEQPNAGPGVLVIPPVQGAQSAAATEAAALPTVAAALPTIEAALPTLEASAPESAQASPTSTTTATGLPTLEPLGPSPEAIILTPTAVTPPAVAVSTAPPLAIQPQSAASPAPNQTVLSLGILSTPTPLATASSSPTPTGRGPGLLGRLPQGWPIALLVILGLAAILLWLLRPRPPVQP